MTVSTHTYTLTAGSTAVTVKGGTVTSDAGQAPRIQASLTVEATAAALAALDPRTTPPPRLTLTAAAVFPTVTQSRSFDLTLRSRSAVQSDATMTIVATSDEGLLIDWAPLTDDYGLFPLASSLRSVVNYVLGKVIAGAALSATPAGDADVSVYSTATNMITNPRGRGNTTGWGANGVSGLNRITNDPVFGTAIQADFTAGAARYVEFAPISIMPGKTYRAELSARASSSHGFTLGVSILNAQGAIVGGSPSIAFPTTGGYSRQSIVFTAPADGTQARLRSRAGDIGGSITAIVSGAMMRENPLDPGDVGFFDGDTADTAVYRYDYGVGADPNTASSTRTALVDRVPESLLWRAGVKAIDFLLPVVQAAGFRLVCDERRVWTLRAAGYTTPGVTLIRYGVNMGGGADEITRDDGDWFDAAITRYSWRDVYGVTQQRTDAYALQTPYTRLELFEKATPFPGVGFSQYAVQRAKGRGRRVTATKAADWASDADQAMQIVLSGSVEQLGLVQTLTFSLDDDSMTVEGRTVDTPPGSIDLLTGTIDGLVGTIDGLT